MSIKEQWGSFIEEQLLEPKVCTVQTRAAKLLIYGWLKEWTEEQITNESHIKEFASLFSEITKEDMKSQYDLHSILGDAGYNLWWKLRAFGGEKSPRQYHEAQDVLRKTMWKWQWGPLKKHLAAQEVVA